MKLDPNDPRVRLLIQGRIGDRAYEARFPRLEFEPVEDDFWRSIYGPGAVKQAQQF
jgi:hypothetical protein